MYDLLLALAGRLDDDLLAWARELVAVGEEGQAVELVTAALAAERVKLPAAVRSAVVAAGRAAHTDLDVARELAPPNRTTRRSTGSTPQPHPVTGWRPCWRVCPRAGSPGARCTSPGDRRPRARRRDRCRGPWCSWKPARTAPRTCWPTCSRPNWTVRPCLRRWRCSPRAPPCLRTTGRRSPRPGGSRWAPRSSRRRGWSSPGRLQRRRPAPPPARRGRPRGGTRVRRSVGRPGPCGAHGARRPGGGDARGSGDRRRGEAGGRTRRRCSWCRRPRRSPRCRALRAAPGGDADRRPVRRRARRSPVIRRPLPEPVPRAAARRSTPTGASPIPPVPDLRTTCPTPTPSTARCGFRCWPPSSIPRCSDPTLPDPTLLDPTLLGRTAPGADEPQYRPPDPTPIRPVPTQPATAPEVDRVQPDATPRTGAENPPVRSAEPAEPGSAAEPRVDRARRSGRCGATAHRRSAFGRDPASHGRRGGGRPGGCGRPGHTACAECAECAECKRPGHARRRLP